MIPKIIHYCWFGKNPIPKSALNCIDSWKKYCPNFEIIEWNEKKFDIDSHKFVKECYELKKYGFIVDVLRMYVLKEFGGIYLDTDVEFIKSIDNNIFNKVAFIGFEQKNYIGVGIVGSVKNGKFVNQVYDSYKDRSFKDERGMPKTSFTGPVGVTEILKKEGFLLDGTYQEVDNYLTVYPTDFFAPKNYMNGITEITKNTITIHHYDASWHDSKSFIENQKLNRKLFYLKQFNNEFLNKQEAIYFYMIHQKVSIKNMFIFYIKYMYIALKSRFKLFF